MDNSRVKLLKLCLMVAIETLAEEKEIPSGHLYAALMTKGVSFAEFQGVQAILVNHLKVSLSSNLLTWTDESQAILDGMKAKV